MDFRTTQDNEMMRTTSAGYVGGGATPITHHLTTKESPATEKRRLSNINIHNGSSNNPTPLSSAFSTPPPHHQTLDHHHHILQPHHVQPVPLPPRDPDPDHRLILSNNNNSVIAPTSTSVKPTKANPPHPPPLTSPPVRYRECLKNHAANIGGNVYDGCGEFMPCSEEGTIEALKCAACDCHRNFHRKETDGNSTHLPFAGSAGPRSSSSRSIMLSPLQLPPPLPSPLPHHHQKFSIVQPMSVAFGAALGGESSSEELNIYDNNLDGNVTATGAATPYGSSSSKKRFRTKFTAEQKERMVEFAERIGWRIQKQDEEDVERFCDEVGVKRQVLRVWMHNNKNTAARNSRAAAA